MGIVVLEYGVHIEDLPSLQAKQSLELLGLLRRDFLRCAFLLLRQGSRSRTEQEQAAGQYAQKHPLHSKK